MDGISQVKELDLSNNLIGAVEFGAFKGMKNLEKLNLATNMLHSLNSSTLNGLTNLKTLDISDNVFTYLKSSWFSNLPHLAELYAGSNQIPSMDAVQLSSPTLQLLSLEKNMISSCYTNKSLIHTPFLQALDLNFNYLSVLETDCFGDLESLKELYISHNKVKTLMAYAFFRLTSLQILDLSNNRLSVLSAKSLNPIVTIEELKLDNNVLTTIGPGSGLANMNKIRVFSAVSCDLKMLDPNTFPFNRFLEKCDKGTPQGDPLSPLLFSLFLADLPDYLDFDGLSFPNSSVKIHLLMYADDIVLLAEDANQLQTALDCRLPKCSVSINGHDLERVPTFVYLGIVFTPQLSFTKHIERCVSKANARLGNPLQCDCNMKYFLEKAVIVGSIVNGTCETPLALMGQNLKLADFSFMKCSKVENLSLTKQANVNLELLTNTTEINQNGTANIFWTFNIPNLPTLCKLSHWDTPDVKVEQKVPCANVKEENYRTTLVDISPGTWTVCMHIMYNGNTTNNVSKCDTVEITAKSQVQGITNITNISSTTTSSTLSETLEMTNISSTTTAIQKDFSSCYP
ncbi:Insulin-like growth factor-binding protein complex acid labile subunit [Nymphon striatum]|nr:Insulin-like growth factor-binding protein complex acid labile subunit [Nymphon striatum]